MVMDQGTKNGPHCDLSAPWAGQGVTLGSLLAPVSLGPVNVHLKLFIVPNGVSDIALGDPQGGGPGLLLR